METIVKINSIWIACVCVCEGFILLCFEIPWKYNILGMLRPKMPFIRIKEKFLEAVYCLFIKAVEVSQA